MLSKHPEAMPAWDDGALGMPAGIIDAMPALLTRVAGPDSFDEVKPIAIRGTAWTHKDRHRHGRVPAHLDRVIADVKFAGAQSGANPPIEAPYCSPPAPELLGQRAV